MTWPNWSVARNRYRQVYLDVGLIDMRAIPDHVLPSSCSLGELPRESLDPPVHRDVVDLDLGSGEALPLVEAASPPTLSIRRRSST